MINPTGVLTGTEVLAIHGSSNYKVRRPIRFGNLAISSQYPKTEVLQDLEVIFTQALEKFVKLEPKNYKHFSIILLIPFTLPRHHFRYLLELCAKMGFKSIMPLLEPVAATYAMAAPSACVVDIGHTQTTIACVDEGAIQTQSVIKKRFGGKDISEIMYRLMISRNALHYFPKDVFWPLEYPYHSMLLDKIKSGFSSLQMGSLEDKKDQLVKVINVWFKEQNTQGINRSAVGKKHPEST